MTLTQIGPPVAAVVAAGGATSPGAPSRDEAGFERPAAASPTLAGPRRGVGEAQARWCCQLCGGLHRSGPCPPLTAVSLFAGVGGFDLALTRAGVDVVAAVEIDKQARGVLADRFPETTLFHDVREVTADDCLAAGFDPDRGVLVGGTPCQDFSLAGRRLGLDGTRSGLIFEFLRLVRDLRPRWLIVENVPGLLSAVCACPRPRPLRDRLYRPSSRSRRRLRTTNPKRTPVRIRPLHGAPRGRHGYRPRGAG